jgi:hypothetical protein
LQSCFWQISQFCEPYKSNKKIFAIFKNCAKFSNQKTQQVHSKTQKAPKQCPFLKFDTKILKFLFPGASKKIPQIKAQKLLKIKNT